MRFWSKSSDEQATKVAELAGRDAERAREEALRAPARQARLARDRGDRVFQFVMTLSQQWYVASGMGGTMTPAQIHHDANAALNAVVNEGWELLDGALTFVNTSEESRTRAGSWGQRTAVAGYVMAIYLFRRDDAVVP